MHVGNWNAKVKDKTFWVTINYKNSTENDTRSNSVAKFKDEEESKFTVGKISINRSIVSWLKLL